MPSHGLLMIHSQKPAQRTQLLFVSDLDGTLLNAEAKLSAFTRSTLQRLLAQGLLFTIATSRSRASVQHIFQGVDLSLPIIEVNGAYVSDLTTGHHHAISTIALDQLPELLRITRAHQCNPLVSTSESDGDHLSCDEISNDGMAWYAESCKRERDKRWRMVPELKPVLTEPVVRFTLIQTEPHIRAAAAEIQQELGLYTHLFENPYHPGWFWLTVQSQQSTKAQAIQRLRSLPQFQEQLNGCELVVFGDEHNDLEMFQDADRAIAPANAVRSIQQLAHEIIGPHTEDSVAQYLIENWEKDQNI